MRMSCLCFVLLCFVLKCFFRVSEWCFTAEMGLLGVTVVSVHIITGQHSSQRGLGIGRRSHHVILFLVTSLIHIDSVALVKSFAIFLFIFIKWLY